MAIVKMQLDPNAAPPETAGRNIRNETGVALAIGDLLYISGWSEAQLRYLITKAANNIVGGEAMLVMKEGLANLTNGVAYRTHRLINVVTTGGVVGNPVYLSTAGGWTLTAPTAAGAFQQIIGRVAVVHATAGVIEIDVMNQPVSVVGSNELQSGSVLSAKIAAAAAKANLDAMADLDRGYIKTVPTTGEFKIISVQRDNTGKLDVDYSDAPEG